MKEKIVIREAAADDVPILADFIRRLAEFEHLSSQVNISVDDLLQFGFSETPYFRALIAEKEGQPLGFALYFFTFSTFVCRPTLYLEDLFVLPEHRGRGVGRALLSELARIARRRNCGRMEWAVLDWNESARTFYRSLGAEELAQWRLCRLNKKALEQLASEEQSR